MLKKVVYPILLVNFRICEKCVKLQNLSLAFDNASNIRDYNKLTSTTPMFFSSVWDPKYIIYQIVAVQSLYYVQFGLTLLIINQLTGHLFSVEQVFNYRLTNTHSSHGWVVIIATIINSILGYDTNY
jgi:hypothetical protein